MKKSFFKIFILSLLINVLNSFGQSVQENREYEAHVDIGVLPFTSTQCVTTTTFGICDGTRFKVINILQSEQKVVVKITRGYRIKTLGTNNDSLPYVIEGNNYCISQTLFNGKYIRESGANWNYGFLVVPFKFHISDYKVYAGGEIGGYIGLKIIGKKNPDNYTTPFVSLGFSQVALNDLNAKKSEDTKSVNALSGALGIAYNFGSDFQIGVLGGVDLFNADNKQVVRDWVSVTIGISILGKKDKKQENRVSLN